MFSSSESESACRADAFDGALCLEVLALLLTLSKRDLADFAGHGSGVVEHEFDLALHVFDIGEEKTIHAGAVHKFKGFEFKYNILTKNIHPHEAPKMIADGKPIPTRKPLHKVIDERADENAIIEMVEILLIQPQRSAEKDEIVLVRHIRQNKRHISWCNRTDPFIGNRQVAVKWE